MQKGSQNQHVEGHKTNAWQIYKTTQPQCGEDYRTSTCRGSRNQCMRYHKTNAAAMRGGSQNQHM
eukprot:1160478-Pelagomonas_calceolata.AAC.11